MGFQTVQTVGVLKFLTPVCLQPDLGTLLLDTILFEGTGSSLCVLIGICQLLKPIGYTRASSQLCR